MTPTISPQQGYAGKKLSGMSPHSVLFISADVGTADRLEAVLRASDILSVECVRTEALFDGLRAIQDGAFDLILFPSSFCRTARGLATLHRLQQHVIPKTPVILLTAMRTGSRYRCHRGSQRRARFLLLRRSGSGQFPGDRVAWRAHQRGRPGKFQRERGGAPHQRAFRLPPRCELPVA